MRAFGSKENFTLPPGNTSRLSAASVSPPSGNLSTWSTMSAFTDPTTTNGFLFSAFSALACTTSRLALWQAQWLALGLDITLDSLLTRFLTWRVGCIAAVSIQFCTWLRKHICECLVVSTLPSMFICVLVPIVILAHYEEQRVRETLRYDKDQISHPWSWTNKSQNQLRKQSRCFWLTNGNT